MLPRLIQVCQKAPIRGAFFMCFLLIAACANNSDGTLYKVKRVIDGDTLILQNKETIRFVGINTPELGHGKFKDEPFANQAREFVKRKIEGKMIRLELAEQQKDRYGRTLAHVYTKDGDNVQVEVLARGLAFAIAVGDNLDFLEPYLDAEQSARNAGKGIWGDRFYAPISAQKAVKGNVRGYQIVVGKVKRVSQSRKNQTLHLEGDFRVLIRRESWKKYFKGRPEHYKGQVIQARGWIFSTHDVTGMKVYHPSMLEVQS